MTEREGVIDLNIKEFERESEIERRWEKEYARDGKRKQTFQWYKAEEGWQIDKSIKTKRSRIRLIKRGGIWKRINVREKNWEAESKITVDLWGRIGWMKCKSTGKKETTSEMDLFQEMEIRSVLESKLFSKMCDKINK